MRNDQPGETITFGGAMPEKKNIPGRSVQLGGKPLTPGAGMPGKKQSDPTETIHVPPGKPVSTKTCVGWLLALRGPNKGGSYEIYPGRNTVGRDRGCVVCLTADRAVSGTQCIISYDHNSKRYFVSCADASTALTQLNGELLLSPNLLKHGDVLTLSEDGKMPDGKIIPGTVLRFVPACDANFSWDMVQD